MRPIKFRIWDKKHKRWFQGSTKPEDIARQTDAISLFGEVILVGSLLHDQNEDDVWKKDPDIKSSLDILNYLEVCQYTGLKDKNGKEIYEGDIVRVTRKLTKTKSAIYIYQIKYNTSRCAFTCWKNNHFCYMLFENSEGDREVVGNIYENPELLEAQG